MISSNKGAVLIISLWVLIILVLLAVSIGWRTSIELRLAKYFLDRLQANNIAQAGLERIYIEKMSDVNQVYDSLDESWSNKLDADGNPVFKKFDLGKGSFVVKYDYPQLQGGFETLYGMQDEQSKLNINKIVSDDGTNDTFTRGVFIELLKSLDITRVDPEAMADRISDWIDTDNNQRVKGKEDYSDMGMTAKNNKLDTPEELLMVDGFSSPKAVKELSEYITLYGDGKLNINTVSGKMLLALGLSEKASEDILNFRKQKSFETIEELTQGPLKNNFTPEDLDVVNSLVSPTIRISVKSNCYKAVSRGTVNSATRTIVSIVDGSFNQKYWYEE